MSASTAAEVDAPRGALVGEPLALTIRRVALPAVLTLLAIPLTFSIAEGIGLGLIAAALLALGLVLPIRKASLSP